MRSALHTGVIVATALACVAGADTQSTQADVQVQLGDLLFAEGRYGDAGEAYRRALGSDTLGSRAGVGVVLSALRLGNFDAAYKDASVLRERYPAASDVAAIHGEALWAYGLFEDAEAAYDAALAADDLEPRGHHGRARSLAARGRLDEALAEAQEALRLNPREGEFYYTAGAIHVRRHGFEEAALAFRNYVNLLPNRDLSEKAAWVRAQIRYLESFKSKRPLAVDGAADTRVWRVPIRIERDKVLVRGRVNGGPPQDFILDTGAEQTVISRDVARRRGVIPVTYIQTAGVGDVGMRGLQVGTLETFEIGDLRIRHVPCLIKNPPLTGLPSREPESFSPLALGLSMRVDYTGRELTIARRLAQERYEIELPLRMHRLAMVGGRVNQTHRAPFVVDTGGEVISISQSTAGIIRPEPAFRRIPLKVYGTSGWDKDAFLMPNVDLEFNTIRFNRIPVVVLNLQAPSVLLGFQLGGIVGHKFLSQYRLSIDLDRSVVGLDRNTGTGH